MQKRNKLKKITSLLGIGGLAAVAAVPVVACADDESAATIWAVFKDTDVVNDKEITTALDQFVSDYKQGLPSEAVAAVFSTDNEDGKKVDTAQIINDITNDALTTVLETFEDDLTALLNEITISPEANDATGELTITFGYGEETRKLVLSGFLEENATDDDLFWNTLLNTKAIKDTDITTKVFGDVDVTQLPSAIIGNTDQQSKMKEELLDTIKEIPALTKFGADVLNKFTTDNITLTADDEKGILKLVFSDGKNNEREIDLDYLSIAENNTRNEKLFWDTFLDSNKVKENDLYLAVASVFAGVKKDQKPTTILNDAEQSDKIKDDLTVAIKNIPVLKSLNSDVLDFFTKDSITLKGNDDDTTIELTFKKKNDDSNQGRVVSTEFSVLQTVKDIINQNTSDVIANNLVLMEINKDDDVSKEISSRMTENLKNNIVNDIANNETIDPGTRDKIKKDSIKVTTKKENADGKNKVIINVVLDDPKIENSYEANVNTDKSISDSQEIRSFVSALFEKYGEDATLILLIISPEEVINDLQETIFGDDSGKVTASEKVSALTNNGIGISNETAKAIAGDISNISLGLLEGFVKMPTISGESVQDFAKNNMLFTADDANQTVRLYLDLTSVNIDIDSLLEGVDLDNLPISDLADTVEKLKPAVNEIKQVFYLEQTDFKIPEKSK